HSGGTGAPPGPNKRSCQELAVRFVFALSAFTRLASAGEGRPGARIELKRGPQPEDAANDMRFGVRGTCAMRSISAKRGSRTKMSACGAPRGARRVSQKEARTP